jgi:bacillithiol system protein YtxJ
MHLSHATADFIPLTAHEQLDAILADRSSGPVLIFKHSWACGTSAEAYEELSGLVDLPIYVVDVLANRPLSNAIAARLGIRHESPQALLIDAGEVPWVGSHWHVTADEVRAALAARA